MAKIQERMILNENTFQELKYDKAVKNHARIRNESELEFAIGIFERILEKSHDLQIYHIKSKEEDFQAVLLVRRGKLDEEKYFIEVLPEMVLKQNVSLKCIIDDESVLNYIIHQSNDVFEYGVGILKRSIRNTLHPSRTEILQIRDNSQQDLFIAVLVQDGLPSDWFEE